MEKLDHWRLCDELTVVQAALLIVGIDPASSKEYLNQLQPEEPNGREYINALLPEGPPDSEETVDESQSEKPPR